MPKISIIVPVYNVEPYLEQCLDSLVNQTLTDIEIICIDDCSTDNSYKIAQQYANKDKRIKLIRTKKNSGLSVARNTGITIANADYIMFCDSDDWYEPDMCEKMLNLITTNGVDLGICSIKVTYETDTSLKLNDKRFTLPDGYFFPNDYTIQSAPVGAPIRIFKREIQKKNNILFPPHLKYEDVFFSNAYNLYVKKIATTSEKLYNYRRHSGSIMNTTYDKHSNMALDYVKVAIYYLDYLKKHNLYEREHNTFWTYVFMSCAKSALMFTKNKQHRHELDTMLEKFIGQYYIFGTVDSKTDYIISLILNGVLMRKKKYLGGLVQIYRDGIKTEYCLWILSIFKIKYTDSQIKYYLFGICIYKKDKE